jgi:putative ABC transport system substrate-binding protein
MAPPLNDYYDEVPKGLKDLGYVEGKNLVVERRYAHGNYERLPELAAELIRLKVDVIVTDGTIGVLGAQKATKTIPIVFGSAGDPVGNGLVQSLGRPGGNTTGISLLAGDSLARKQLEMLHSLVPKLTRLAALYNPSNPYSVVVLKNLDSAARPRHLQVLRVEARTAAEIEQGFRLMTEQKADAFIWIADAILSQQMRQIAALAVTHRLPGMGAGRTYATAGGLLGYGSNQFNNYRRAAAIVDKILRGANPGELPVEQPTNLFLGLNRGTARALGLTIPPELLLLADEVIE